MGDDLRIGLRKEECLMFYLWRWVKIEIGGGEEGEEISGVRFVKKLVRRFVW